MDRSTRSSSALPLPVGAIRREDGQVIVPASKRADGSTRKPIRIRQGYIPQEEVPKYKTVAQRRREAEEKAQAAAQVDEKKGDTVSVDGKELSLESLSLEQKQITPSASASASVARRQRKEEEENVDITETLTGDDSKEKKPRSSQLKQELTKINKTLKEIGKLETREQEGNTLTHQQKNKIARKQPLQQKRNEIIAELNGATVQTNSSSSSHDNTIRSSTSSPRKFVAISL